MFSQPIERYASGAEALHRAIRGLSDADLDAIPVPGTWSMRQVVVHLMESDLIGTDRLKRIAAMDRPLLIGYDESAFVRVLHPARIDAAMSAEVFKLNRILTAAVLRSLPPEAFERWGVHNERGAVTLLDLLNGYSDHLEHHWKFIADKRAKLGKPL